MNLGMTGRVVHSSGGLGTLFGTYRPKSGIPYSTNTNAESRKQSRMVVAFRTTKEGYPMPIGRPARIHNDLHVLVTNISNLVPEQHNMTSNIACPK